MAKRDTLINTLINGETNIVETIPMGITSPNCKYETGNVKTCAEVEAANEEAQFFGKTLEKILPKKGLKSKIPESAPYESIKETSFTSPGSKTK